MDKNMIPVYRGMVQIYNSYLRVGKKTTFEYTYRVNDMSCFWTLEHTEKKNILFRKIVKLYTTNIKEVK